MPEYLAPGVYVEDVGVGRQPIAAASTSTVAFVGATPTGPLNEPIIVGSFADYRETFDPATTSCPVSLALQLFFVNGGKRAQVVRVAASARSDRRSPDPKTVIGDAKAKTGIHALRDDEPLDLLLTPDASEMSAAQATKIAGSAVAFCQSQRVFYLLDVPYQIRSKHDRILACTEWAKRNTALRHANVAAYLPRISLSGLKGDNRPLLTSPNGAIAGLYVRSDAMRGVWKAPAGLDARLHGVEAAEIELTDQQMDLLRGASINPLRRIEGRGVVPWGAYTFQSAGSNSDWRYVPVRRLGLLIEKSLYRGLTWAVFEPNGEPLWAQVRLAVSSFMNQLFRAGAFQGASSIDAYFVKCDRETMTQSDIDNGRLNAVIGFAPLKPAEFVILRIQLRSATTT